MPRSPTRARAGRPPFAPRLKHKFNAQPTEALGKKYASKAEARYALWLQTQRQAGTLLFWLEQVPFRIPGGTYRLDFLTFWADGTTQLVDVKGLETESFRFKKKAVEELYPVEITIIKGKDVPRVSNL